MSDYPGFLSPRSVARMGLLRNCHDPFSDEAAQEFLRSENVEWALDNTFKDAKIEFEDLDGLSWPTKPTPPPAVDLHSPLLEPLFSPGKSLTTTAIREAGWICVPPSPATCCQCGSDRSACQLHPRKLSRSRRASGVSLNFPRVEVPDPFAFLPTPSGREQQSDTQKTGQSGASITRPLSVEQTESPSKPFRLLELPPEEVLWPIGPPPGLPPPRSGLQPPQGVPFPIWA